MIVFQVENTLFKIHRYLLSKSILAMNLPPTAESNAEGSLSNPIKLNGIRVADFEALLSVLYHPPLSPIKTLSTEQLVKALEMAVHFDMNELAMNIAKRLTKRPHDHSLALILEMLRCCIVHPDLFDRSYFLTQFTYASAHPDRISPENLHGMNVHLVAALIEGREAMSAAQASSGWGSPGTLMRPVGWSQILDRLFPSSPTGGWQFGSENKTA
ncbi:hypothetical protein FRC14_005708 [Serendipita sp. 396]|nr:hypothetical protein FRC14_005708 [Serendipita sp. 396]